MKTKDAEFADDRFVAAHLSVLGERCRGCGGAVRARRRLRDHRWVVVCAESPQCNVVQTVSQREERLLRHITRFSSIDPTEEREYGHMSDSTRRSFNLARAQDRALAMLERLCVEDDPFGSLEAVQGELFENTDPQTSIGERQSFLDCVRGAFLAAVEQADIHARQWEESGELPGPDEVRELCGHVCAVIAQLVRDLQIDFDRPGEALRMAHLSLIYAQGVLAPWGDVMPLAYQELIRGGTPERRVRW